MRVGFLLDCLKTGVFMVGFLSRLFIECTFGVIHLEMK